MKQFCVTLLCLLGLSAATLLAQDARIQRVDPTNWWVGMKDPKLQLLVYGKNLSKAKVSTRYPGITVGKITSLPNTNYVAVDLTIAPTTKPGTVPLLFTVGGQTITHNYRIAARDRSRDRVQGLTSADLVYLILPDRFSNGDPSNDKFPDMADPNADRNNPYYRHGGDLQGIINHLDYFNELGVTALWLNPVIENDQPLTNEGGAMRSAYHGYGFTDHYRVDRRLGGNEAYKKLVNEAHKKGIKIIQDAVYNHVGANHWLLKDMPAKDWLNQWPTYTNTSYKDQPLLDPYASELDKKVTLDGWFVPHLPDLNQKNPVVANYLIQHALWTVEEFGIDAWRIDTYIYNDLAFMNRCNQALLDNFPNIHLFGESWVGSVPNQAYFTRNNIESSFKCNLPGGMDFQVYNALNETLKRDNPETVYSVLAQDYLYKDASRNLIFLDNHDTDRYFSVIGEDMNKFKMGLVFLMTSRGIPQIYYGTEVLMKNFKDPSDAEVRRDFPGGFADDKANKFTAAGRTKVENDVFDFVRQLGQYRKQSAALKTGKLMQFLPQNNVYAYARYTDAQTVMVFMNSGKKDATVETARFAERLRGYSRARNVLTGEVISNLTTLNVPAQTALLLELQK
ncbi:alpha-amylase [Rudanella paleaurantiibacter]|uniref:Alpha-amylase n=1 Tax=Rudanella paleaurantiibacter TaxID=2614655 RepID=A0A7J5TUV0_9BACT|nr:glycoside hydrolase family 13 protein [Rudanella paleaurantiibacter]KAB7727539.1 alpha-amylase [Rudanella paleaurantiibacter]